MTRSLLVVDDDVFIRNVLADTFRDEGYTVQTAKNGAEALTTSQANPPALILLDLMMPVMDGWGFLEERLRQATLLRIPVIVLTAARSFANFEWDRLAVFQVLSKPFDVDQLVTTVGQLVPR